jgi:hypothetical protein
MKVTRLSALRTGLLGVPGHILGIHFYYKLSRPLGHSAAGKIKTLKNPSGSLGNRNRDLPGRSAVSQPIAPPRNLVSGIEISYSFGYQVYFRNNTVVYFQVSIAITIVVGNGEYTTILRPSKPAFPTAEE